MATKAKPKTGGAVLDDSQPDTNSDAALSDAQSTQIGPGSAGFVAVPNAPGPSGPSFGMGGDVTQPSDFAKEVAAATNVQSKGGPPPEELSVSSGKGPVGKLKKPSETTSTTKAPEDKPAPSPPEIGPGSAGFVAVPQATPSATPAAAPPATSTATSTTAAPAASDQTQIPTDSDGKPLEAFQHHNDLIQKYAKPYQSGDQDYSRLDPYISQDPNFAGLMNGVPFFMGADRRPYFRDETGPGKEIRHYADAPAGTHEAENGVAVEDEQKAAMSRDAQQRMLALIQTQQAITDWQQKLNEFKAKNPGGENALQRLGLQTLLSGATDPVSNALRTVADMSQGVVGITDKMKELDAARAQVAASWSQATAKNLPTSEATRTALNLPLTADDFATQQTRINAIQDAMAREAKALQTLYPYGNRQVEALLKQIGQGKSTPPGAQQNAPDVTGNADAYAKLKTGDSFIYKGKTYQKK